MYIAQEVSERIKKLAREQGIGQGELLKSCGCNTSTLNQMSGDKGISSFSLARIADALDCSVDYLLCRTENPDAHKTHISDVVVNPYSDEQLAAIVEAYKQLNLVGKAKLLVETDKIISEESNLINRTENTPGNNNYLLLAGKGGSAEVEIKDPKGLNEEVEKLKKKHGLE